MMRFEKNGYELVECDEPLPCPFCGQQPELSQLAHANSRKGRICIIASSGTLKADTFWFKCSACHATTGRHQETAQAAVEIWNQRATLTTRHHTEKGT